MVVGVYRLTHVPTGRFYIGSSGACFRRFRVWQFHFETVLRRGFSSGVSARMCAAFAGTVWSDWNFRVVEVLPDDSTEAQLRLHEQRHLRRFVGKDRRCLNSDRLAYVAKASLGRARRFDDVFG